jgi:hypothetical protein
LNRLTENLQRLTGQFTVSGGEKPAQNAKGRGKPGHSGVSVKSNGSLVAG